MPTYRIDSDNNLAVHPDKDAAVKEYGPTLQNLARIGNSAPMSFDFKVGSHLHFNDRLDAIHRVNPSGRPTAGVRPQRSRWGKSAVT